MNNAQSLKEKVVKGSVIVLVMTLLGSFFAYLIRILYSRTLTIEDYGLFYAVLAMFGIATAYIDLGFGYSMVYLLPKYLKVKDYAKAWNIFIHGLVIPAIMSVVVATILAISAPFLAKNYFKIAGSENLIYIFCIYIVTSTVLNTLSQIYTGLQKPKYYSSITVSKWLLIFVFSQLFFLFKFSNVIYYAIAWALAHIATTIIFLYLLYLHHPFLTGNKIILEGKTLKLIWVFAFPALIESVMYSFVILTDTFFLTLFRGVREVGIYNIIYPIASISMMLLNPLNGLILPLVSHLMEGEKDKLTYLVEKVLEITPFIGVYFALFKVMFPSSVVGLIFGSKWLGLVEFPLTIIALGVIGLLMSIILGTILIGTGRIRERLKIFAFVGIFHVIFNAIFIWKMGVLGVAITNSLVGLSLSILFARIIRGIIPFEAPYMFYIKLLIFASLAYLIVKITAINPQNWFEFVAAGMIYTMIFAIFGFILKVYDKRILFMILPKKNE